MIRRIVALVLLLGLLAGACDASTEDTTTTSTTTTTAPPSTTTSTWPSELQVSTSDDLAALVAAAPEGITFNLDPGVHRPGLIEPKTGMTFSGSADTILSGAIELEGFTQDGARWELTGVPLDQDERCLDAAESCGPRNDLFLDDVKLTRVVDVAQVGSGSWWGTDDRIVMGDDPAGRTVELSVTSHAFAGDAADVVLRGLVVAKYAVPSRDGAIQSQALDDGPLGTDWVIEGVEVRNNHGAGIRLGRGTQVRSAIVADNGPIAITGVSNPERLIEGVMIEDLTVSNESGDCVSIIHGSNVVLNTSTIGPCGGEAVYISDTGGAEVSGNVITDAVIGVLVHLSTSVVVDDNTFEDSGRNFVQFDKVTGSGSSISQNQGENDLGDSTAEDMISLFESSGTPESPIRIVGNRLRNGGPSDSGSGILLGDHGGSYQIADDNRLVNPGQVGIGVASGIGITVSNNLVYSDAQPWSNVGVYVWNQTPTECATITVSGNQVNWTSSTGQPNHWFNGGGCSGVDRSDNEFGAEIGPGIL